MQRTSILYNNICFLFLLCSVPSWIWFLLVSLLFGIAWSLYVHCVFYSWCVNFLCDERTPTAEEDPCSRILQGVHICCLWKWYRGFQTDWFGKGIAAPKIAELVFSVMFVITNQGFAHWWFIRNSWGSSMPSITLALFIFIGKRGWNTL